MDTTGWRRFVPGAPEETVTTPSPVEETPARDSNVAYIDRGVEMSGRLVVPKSLRIEGEFSGELESKESVWISEGAAVEAPIRARSVEIRGAVVGNIVATREVVIHATGRLHGDVETPCLVVARGATFNGKSRMYRPEREVQATTAHERLAEPRA